MTKKQFTHIVRTLHRIQFDAAAAGLASYLFLMPELDGSLTFSVSNNEDQIAEFFCSFYSSDEAMERIDNITNFIKKYQQ